MKTSQLAPWANLGGALSPKHFASFNVVGIFSHVLPKSLASKLRKLILIGSCWLVTAPVFASFAVTLAWDANPETDLVGYKLSYGTASGTYTNVISTGLVTEISVPNLVEGTTYYFAVAAVNAAGAQSLNSNEVSYSFTTSGTVVPPTVVVPQITNQAPVAANESLTVNEDTPLNLVLQGTDTNGDTLTYSVVNSPTRGQLTGVAPNLTYSPAPNDYGTDSLTFVVNDGQVTSAVATVLITILPVNDSPVAIAQTVTTAQNFSVTITLDGSDPEGDLLTGLIVTAPTNGTASVTGRQILYTPGVNYSGGDQITFRLNDGGASSAAATISITVVAPTIAPIVTAVQAPATPITVSVTTPPLPWKTANIGVGQAPGSLLYSQGDFVQTGAGALGGTTDKLNFIYQPLTGDGQITVKISANQKIGYSGISIRESLAPNARKIFLGVNSSNNHVMVSRSTTAAKNYVKSLTSNSTTQQWIRLVRNYKKSYFYAYSSSDGVTWRLIGSKLIKMSNTCQVGLSVCSGNDTTTTTSTFSSVVAIP